jgi:predicted site-specific integrase-resolvase
MNDNNNNQSSDIRYISKDQVCKKMNVSRTGLESLIRNGEILPVKLPHMRRIVFVESEVNDLQRQLNETSRGRSQFGGQSR